uniref:Uncharacterized protein n=1 Tax=Romanomermis culicivorax TaxID=13658 RepID=A0A915KYB8_ROMCU
MFLALKADRSINDFLVQADDFDGTDDDANHIILTTQAPTDSSQWTYVLLYLGVALIIFLTAGFVMHTLIKRQQRFIRNQNMQITESQDMTQTQGGIEGNKQRELRALEMQQKIKAWKEMKKSEEEILIMQSKKVKHEKLQISPPSTPRSGENSALKLDNKSAPST